MNKQMPKRVFRVRRPRVNANGRLGDSGVAHLLCDGVARSQHEIEDALAQRGLPHGQGTVSQALMALRRAGWVVASGRTLGRGGVAVPRWRWSKMGEREWEKRRIKLSSSSRASCATATGRKTP